jgi:hypothetical protein
MNQSRNPITIGFSKRLCDKNAITQYHHDEPSAGNLSVSVFATFYNYVLLSKRPAIPALDP